MRFIYRLFKYGLGAALGAALAAKLLLDSNARPDTEEIDLVSIFEGTSLSSVADPFYGGRVLNLFAGTNLDLRRAQPGPTGMSLDLSVVCGGLNILVPEGWRVTSDLNLMAGGINDATRTDSNPDAVTLHLSGFVVLGGVNVQAKPAVEAVV